MANAAPDSSLASAMNVLATNWVRAQGFLVFPCSRLNMWLEELHLKRGTSKHTRSQALVKCCPKSSRFTASYTARAASRFVEGDKG